MLTLLVSSIMGFSVVTSEPPCSPWRKTTTTTTTAGAVKSRPRRPRVHILSRRVNGVRFEDTANLVAFNRVLREDLIDARAAGPRKEPSERAAFNVTSFTTPPSRPSS